jgi:hypothetical protein
LESILASGIGIRRESLPALDLTAAICEPEEIKSAGAVETGPFIPCYISFFAHLRKQKDMCFAVNIATLKLRAWFCRHIQHQS